MVAEARIHHLTEAVAVEEIRSRRRMMAEVAEVAEETAARYPVAGADFPTSDASSGFDPIS